MRAAAFLALLVLAPAASGASAVQVGWREWSEERAFEGVLAEGGERAVVVDLDVANLTRVEAALAWEDEDGAGLSAPDRFRLRLDGPRGLGAPPQDSAAGRLQVAARVRETPPPSEVRSAEDLEALASDAGRGAWTVTVQLVETGDPPGAFVDPGEAWRLTVTYRRYEAVPLRVVTLDEGAAEAPDQVRWAWAAGGLAAASVALGLVAWRRR